MPSPVQTESPGLPTIRTAAVYASILTSSVMEPINEACFHSFPADSFSSLPLCADQLGQLGLTAVLPSVVSDEIIP